MQIVVADVIRVSASSVCRILPKVSLALIRHLDAFIKMPETFQERDTAAAEFYRFAQFPRTIRAIDCTHVKVQSPGGEFVSFTWNLFNFHNRCRNCFKNLS